MAKNLILYRSWVVKQPGQMSQPVSSYQLGRAGQSHAFFSPPWIAPYILCVDHALMLTRRYVAIKKVNENSNSDIAPSGLT